MIVRYQLWRWNLRHQEVKAFSGTGTLKYTRPKLSAHKLMSFRRSLSQRYKISMEQLLPQIQFPIKAVVKRRLCSGKVFLLMNCPRFLNRKKWRQNQNQSPLLVNHVSKCQATVRRVSKWVLLQEEDLVSTQCLEIRLMGRWLQETARKKTIKMNPKRKMLGNLQLAPTLTAMILLVVAIIIFLAARRLFSTNNWGKIWGSALTMPLNKIHLHRRTKCPKRRFEDSQSWKKLLYWKRKSTLKRKQVFSSNKVKRWRMKKNLLKSLKERIKRALCSLAADHNIHTIILIFSITIKILFTDWNYD